MSSEGYNTSRVLLSNVIVTGVSPSVKRYSSRATFQAVGIVSAATGVATILIEVSNDNVNFSTAATISLTLGTTTIADGVVMDAKWTYVRVNLSAISGTNATVSVTMGN